MFAKIFRTRLSALSRAQALLNGDRQVPLREIVLTEMVPYQDREGQIVVADGPDILAGGEATQALAMVLHELAANATKHGALTGPNGTVLVNWRINAAETRPCVTLLWMETGGPPVASFLRPGLGTRLIERAVEDLDGEVVREFLAEGIQYTIDLPVAESSGCWHIRGRFGGRSWTRSSEGPATTVTSAGES
jgi:two-component system, chemotaxis family, CheB/CheR fusion protein